MIADPAQPITSLSQPITSLFNKNAATQEGASPLSATIENRFEQHLITTLTDIVFPALQKNGIVQYGVRTLNAFNELKAESAMLGLPKTYEICGIIYNGVKLANEDEVAALAPSAREEVNQAYKKMERALTEARHYMNDPGKYIGQLLDEHLQSSADNKLEMRTQPSTATPRP